MIEFLPASAPWPIEMPAEPDRGRVLEARRQDNGAAQQWVYEYEAWWLNDMMPFTWAAIVSECIRNGWALFSMPPETEER